MRKTRCSIFLTSSETVIQAKNIREAVPNLKIFEVPRLHDLLYPEEPSCYYQGLHKGEDDAHCLILHTSGSTGMHNF